MKSVTNETLYKVNNNLYIRYIIFKVIFDNILGLSLPPTDMHLRFRNCIICMCMYICICICMYIPKGSKISQNIVVE